MAVRWRLRAVVGAAAVLLVILYLSRPAPTTEPFFEEGVEDVHAHAEFIATTASVSTDGRAQTTLSTEHVKHEDQALKRVERYVGASSWQRHGHLAIQPNGEPHWKPSAAPAPGGNIWAELAGNGFNARLSDSISLDRNVSDIRHPECAKVKYDYSKLPRASVVIVFHNEWLSALLRSVHSVLNRTPPEILEEIVLVDDGSDKPWLREQLQEHVDLLPKTKLVRLPVRSGLVIARLKGVEASKGEVFVVLDSHIEVVEGWLEPLVYRIGQDRKVMVMPVIASVEQETMTPEPGGIGCTLGFLWNLIEHGMGIQEKDRHHMKSDIDYSPSPAMAGGLFAGNREFFWELGGYDRQFGFWGTENLELSFRLWQCGGRLECTICSNVHHIFRKGGHPYSMPGGHVAKNKMRTSLIWMDEFGDLARRSLGNPRMDYGSLTEMRALREKLQCKPFSWFLKNVYPESLITEISDIVSIGQIKNAGGKGALAMNGGSLGVSPNGLEWLIVRVRNAEDQHEIRPMFNLEDCVIHSGRTVNCDWHQSEGQWTVDPVKRLIRFWHGTKCISAPESSGAVAYVDCDENDAKQQWTYTPYTPVNPAE
eukprot:m.179076 g.179076  ORF g.179076 m.179076 type:complete len:594 (-) comp53415_c0_seq2:1232-3013(-)